LNTGLLPLGTETVNKSALAITRKTTKKPRYMGRHLLICVGTRFLNLLERPGTDGDHGPSEDRGDEEDEENAGDRMLALYLANGSRVGKTNFSFSMCATQCPLLAVLNIGRN
jgi:hypothetical protein